MSKNDAKDFMDRQIVFVRPKHKMIRAVNGRFERVNFYAEISIFRNKAFIILVNLNSKKSK